jgi:chemotaxis methyl-accepting protein methylase
MSNMLIGFVLGWVAFTASGREAFVIAYRALDTAGARIVTIIATDLDKVVAPRQIDPPN